jgi:hypothetical protein
VGLRGRLSPACWLVKLQLFGQSGGLIPVFLFPCGGYSIA